MFADHLAKRLQLQGLPFLILSDLIGRLAFPIFCMLLAEGYFHTRSRLRYILRVLLLALLSEVPYDLLFFDVPCNWRAQNTCFTLTLGLLLFSVLHFLIRRRDLDFRAGIFLQAAAVAASCAAAHLMHFDYGAGGIAALAVFFYGMSPQALRSGDNGTKKRSTAAAAACLCLNVDHFYNAGAFLSLIPLTLYSGKRGVRSAAEKYAFYLYYPFHLLLIGALIRG